MFVLDCDIYIDETSPFTQQTLARTMRQYYSTMRWRRYAFLTVFVLGLILSVHLGLFALPKDNDGFNPKSFVAIVLWDVVVLLAPAVMYILGLLLVTRCRLRSATEIGSNDVYIM